MRVIRDLTLGPRGTGLQIDHHDLSLGGLLHPVDIAGHPRSPMGELETLLAGQHRPALSVMVSEVVGKRCHHGLRQAPLVLLNPASVILKLSKPCLDALPQHVSIPLRVSLQSCVDQGPQASLWRRVVAGNSAEEPFQRGGFEGVYSGGRHRYGPLGIERLHGGGRQQAPPGGGVRARNTVPRQER